MTSADNTDTATISTRPNSDPSGRWATTYGSKNMYSEIIESGINNPINIATANATYLKFEKTRLSAFNLNH